MKSSVSFRGWLSGVKTSAFCQVQRALYQCREQSWDMLERACQAVEQAAEGGGVFPEVLFEVARHWYEMAEECSPANPTVEVMPGNNNQSQATSQRRESESPSIVGAPLAISQVGGGVEKYQCGGGVYG